MPFQGLSRRTCILIAICFAAAALVAVLVRGGEDGPLHRVDEGILLALRNPLDRADPVGPLWMEIFFRDVTALGSHAVIVLVGLVVAGYLALQRERASVMLLAASLAGGAILSASLKLAFGRPRPELVAHLADIHTASFPSGHAMLSAVAYLTLAGLLARVQPQPRLRRFVIAVGIGTTALVGISRVYLGVHWPTDVVAGWLLGAAWALTCRAIADRIEGRRFRLRTDG
ncbi:phosphatase PAP2 family protein [Allostella vacuolata]|nr:phosphatase PAP2 family protein [Stella vacuolata]